MLKNLERIQRHCRAVTSNSESLLRYRHRNIKADCHNQTDERTWINKHSRNRAILRVFCARGYNLPSESVWNAYSDIVEPLQAILKACYGVGIGISNCCIFHLLLVSCKRFKGHGETSPPSDFVRTSFVQNLYLRTSKTNLFLWYRSQIMQTIFLQK